MIKLGSLIIISSTIPIVDYNPPTKYVLDNDYSDFSVKHEPVDNLTDVLYKTLIKEIEEGVHDGQIPTGR